MKTGFLTRLLQVNQASPHVERLRNYDQMLEARESDVQMKYACDLCLNDDFDTYAEAYDCCERFAKVSVTYLEPDALMVDWAWMCQVCYEERDSEEAARECCPRIKSVSQRYECFDCWERHDSVALASYCCAIQEDLLVEGRAPQCMVCMRAVEGGGVTDKSEPLSWWIAAAECCLPVKSDVLTTVDCREVGKLLVRGVSWTDAVAQVEAAARERQCLAVH